VVKGRSKKKIFLWGIVTMLILYALVYPFAALALNFYLIDYSLRNSKTALEEGDFNKAMSYTNNSLNYIRRSQSLVESVSILKNVGVVGDGVSNLEDLLNLAETGISGLKDATEGSQNLYLTSKVISGEDNADPTNYYQNSQDKLTQASREIASVKAQLSDPSFVEKYPTFIRPLITQTALKVDGYFNVIDKARTASYIMPEITGVGGKKKTYLVLFLNNLELRSGGGFIGSYGRLTFQNGKLIDIKVDDIYNLDGSLGEVIAPPEPLKTDLNIQRLFLRDTNYEPDFPTNARLAETFYKKEANEDVDGVFSIDLTGSGKLLDAIGGVDLSEYGEHVDGNNLFEKSITHAEVNFFPGSQAKKNYLTSLQNQLFNKVFYLSKQNWPAIIEAVGYSLDSKHLMVYLNDPKLSSYMISENWSGVMPRGVTVSDTTYQDFLSINESNVGANKVNFYLEKSYKLEVIIGKQGEISHRLVANYKNNSPTDVFPAGKYKNRFRVYLPIGAKLTKADFSGQDVLGRFSSFADYERAGYTALLEVAPKEQKTLTLEYQLQKLLQFNNSIASYNLDIVKQAGSQKDPLDISLNYPINMTVNSSSFAAANNQSNSITTDLERDRSISATISIK
jgi:hypothetical protein